MLVTVTVCRTEEPSVACAVLADVVIVSPGVRMTTVERQASVPPDGGQVLPASAELTEVMSVLSTEVGFVATVIE